MGKIDIRDLRHLLGNIEEELKHEGELVLTHEGRAIARIVPVRSQPAGRATSHADLRARMHKVAQSSVLLRDDRDAR